MNHQEAKIQHRLWLMLRWKRNHPWVVPNFGKYFSTGECDVLSINRSGSAYEWEIKISRSDFKNDAKKTPHMGGGKYDLYEAARRGDNQFHIANHWYRENDPRVVSPPSWAKDLNTPHYFSYVVPEGLVGVEDCPEWAGLFYVKTNVYGNVVITEIRKPTRIHKTPLPTDIYAVCGQKLMYRFWTERERTNELLDQKERVLEQERPTLTPEVLERALPLSLQSANDDRPLRRTA